MHCVRQEYGARVATNVHGKDECIYHGSNVYYGSNLGFKAHRLVYHSTPGSRVIKKKKKKIKPNVR